MTKKGIFKIVKPSEAPPASAEALFRDLRQRSASIRHLWSHQADLLRDYEKHVDAHDVALELPTGAGKTLVGLLIAEYRRRAKNERVLYMCPTRQLAHQVGKQAGDYGIHAVVLVGQQQKFEPGDYASYASAKSIGITTYSGVFNKNPYRLSDAAILVLDDAHAAENYVSSLWTVEIDRETNKEIYLGILDILADKLRSNLVDALRTESHGRNRVLIDTVPLPYFWERAEQIRQFVDAKIDGKPSYPWKMIRENLLACNLFLSWRRITYRLAGSYIFRRLPLSFSLCWT